MLTFQAILYCELALSLDLFALRTNLKIAIVLQLVEFKKEIDRYIESKDNPQGGEFWPIVKHVKIRIPNCSVCSNGAVLVDLPGVGDSNAARNKIAKEVS